MDRHKNLRGPDPYLLKQMLRRGLSHQECADEWCSISGVRVGRTTITEAVRRYGFTDGVHRPRHESLLPWRVRVAHTRHKDAVLLRLEARRRSGDAIRPKDLRWLGNWLRALRDVDCVIAYAPDTAEGFFWTRRLPEDVDIIRRSPIR